MSSAARRPAADAPQPPAERDRRGPACAAGSTPSPGCSRRQEPRSHPIRSPAANVSRICGAGRATPPMPITRTVWTMVSARNPSCFSGQLGHYRSIPFASAAGHRVARADEQRRPVYLHASRSWAEAVARSARRRTAPSIAARGRSVWWESGVDRENAVAGYSLFPVPYSLPSIRQQPPRPPPPRPARHPPPSPPSRARIPPRCTGRCRCPRESGAR